MNTARPHRLPTLPPWALALGIAGAGVIAVYWPLFTGSIVHHRDIGRWIVPARWFVRTTVLRGELPLWNPDVGLGLSALADPLYGLFYPPNLLHLLGPLPQMAVWWMFLHLVFGAAGAGVLARSAGAGAVAAITAAAAWALSNLIAAQWTIGLLLPAAAWIPWVSVGFTHLARDAANCRDARLLARATGLAALPTALAFLLGEVFIAVMAVGFGLGVGLAAMAAQDQRAPAGITGSRGRSWGRFALAAAGALGIAACLAALVVLPATRAVAGSERAAPLPADVAEAWSVHPQHLLDLAVAGGHGLAWESDANAQWVGQVLGDNPLSIRLYVGGSVLALALLSLGRRRGDASVRRRRSLALALGALGGAAILVAMGRYLPAHAALRWLVRPLAYMRFPEKYLLVFAAAVSVMAGLGAQRLGGEPRRPWRREVVLGVALLLLGALAGALFPGHLATVMRRGAVHAGLGALGVGVAALLARRAGKAAGLVALGVVVADLGVGAAGTLRFGSPSLIADRPPAATAILDRFVSSAGTHPRLYRSPGVQEAVARAGRHDPELSSRDTLRDNLSLLHGIAILPGYDAASSVQLNRLLALGRQDVLRLLGVDAALLSDRGQTTGTRPATPVMGPTPPGSRLLPVDSTLPRVYRASRSESLSTSAAVDRVLSPEVLSGRTVILDDRERPPILAGDPAPGDGCHLVAFSANRIEAVCHGAGPGFAVFVEQHAPGWHATVDGTPTPILLANTVARAVPVPHGDCHVVLSFSPPGMRPAMLAGALGTLLLLGCLLARGRDRQPTAG